MFKKIASDLAVRVSALKLLVMLSLCALLLSGFFLFHGRTRAVEAQEITSKGELRWAPNPNGFSGMYKSGDQSFPVESFHLSPDFVLTRILKPDGNTLMEILRNGESVTVTLAETRISFEISGSREFPESEKVKLQTASSSTDAKVARKVISATIAQLRQQHVERRFLTGLGVASLILGNEKGRGDGASTSQASAGTTADVCTDASSNCLGCCGSGCTGCIGCCTEACLQHDRCVRTIGQFRCLGLLPAAIVSIFNECL